MNVYPVTMAVLEVAHHAQRQWREWLAGNVLEQMDGATLRRVMERQNAVMALLISELELENGSRSDV
jgi:hypothetical protein